MKLLIDMNLSPGWVAVFERQGWPSCHWSNIGDPGAADQVIMSWAREHAHVVFTHDLDFGVQLAFTHENGPSVVQVRTQNVMIEHLQHLVVAALHKYEPLLEQGSLMTIDEHKSRVRILPF